MGSANQGYRAVRESVGWRQLSERGFVAVRGPDRVDFLHNMISNDVEGMTIGQGRHGTLLTPTGKMVADFHYYLLEGLVLLTLSLERIAPLLATLDGYIVMDDVTLEDLTPTRVTFSIQGPASEELVGGWLNEAPPRVGFAREIGFEGSLLWWVNRPSLGEQGSELFVDPAVADQVTSHLEGMAGAGVVRVSDQTWALLQLEEGQPRFGVDIDETSNPLEAGFHDAISFEKGCYVGQEVIARATHIGGIPRRLVRVELDGEIGVPAGAALLTSDGERRVGVVTSCRWSPVNERVIGLARVRTKAAASGTVLQGEAGNGSLIQVRVVEHFPAEV